MVCLLVLGLHVFEIVFQDCQGFGFWGLWFGVEGLEFRVLSSPPLVSHNLLIINTFPDTYWYHIGVVIIRGVTGGRGGGGGVMHRCLYMQVQEGIQISRTWWDFGGPAQFHP